MEKGLEFFDAGVKSQKGFLETGLKSQKEFMTNWTESIQNLQASFLNLGGFQEGPGKEMLNLFNPWFNTMANSTRVFSDEVVKIQETWKGAFEKQMEMSREMAKNSFEFFSSRLAKKNGDIDIEEREQVAKRHDSETSVKSFHRGGKKSGRSGIVA